MLRKTKEEIEIMAASGEILSKVHGKIAEAITDGISTIFLDKIAEDFILNLGAKPAFKGYGNYKHTICASLNDCIVHGVPSDLNIIKNGDILSIDCGVLYRGYYSDSAFTYIVGGEAPEKIKNLVYHTQKALEEGIKNFILGAHIGDVSNAIMKYAIDHGYSLAENLVGHGIGKNLHEKPNVPNIGYKNSGEVIKEGLVIAIEPMLCIGNGKIKEIEGKGIYTKDGGLSAHFESTVAIYNNNPIKLTSFEYIKVIL